MQGARYLIVGIPDASYAPVVNRPRSLQRAIIDAAYTRLYIGQSTSQQELVLAPACDKRRNSRQLGAILSVDAFDTWR